MSNDILAVATIVGMALVTYLSRIGGVWLTGRVPQTPRIEAWLRHIPGAVLVSIIAPAVLAGGPAEGIAVAATGLAALRTRNFLLAIVLGVTVAWLLRRLFPLG